MSELYPVSTNIESFTYNKEDSILSVSFHNGRTYEYLDVPILEAAEFAFAPSVGAYLNKVIKPKYKVKEFV